MRHAIDINGEKITPVFSGQIAICGFCGQKVRGKCGKILIWHWQHVHNEDCDSWKEGETDWHLAWKNRFPFEWQETIIIKNEEKHIADILTDDGLVIEFQNSSITPAAIAEREKFYRKIIWVINAESFKNNLVTENISEKQLAELDSEYALKRNRLSRQNCSALENVRKNQNTRALEIQSKEYSLSRLMSVTDIFAGCNKNAETFAEQILNIWQSDNLSVDPDLIEITNDDAIVSKKPFFRLRKDLKLNRYLLDSPGKTSSEIDRLSIERNELLKQLEGLKPLLIKELKFVASKYLYLEEEIAHLKNVLLFLKGGMGAGDKEIQDLKAEIDNYVTTKLQILEDAYLEKRNSILQDKDKLNFTWKQGRKSWLSAAAPIYFDLGDGTLLYRHADNKVSSITVSDFISRYSPADS